MLSAFPPAGGIMGAMNDNEDITLLRAWARERSETAFRAVVERYAGLVFGVALRRTGERPLAEEAVQNVFADLARKAAVIVELQRPLAAWLHRCAIYESATVLRSEIRHREKMKRFAYTPADEPAPDPWQEVRPFLDDAINALSEPDRRVLLLHWFERRTFADIAEKTGSTAAAAQRRGLRALDKLAALLRRRGTVIPAAILAAGLTPQLSHAAPAGLAASVSTAAIHAAPAAGGLTLFIQQSLCAMSSAKLTTAAVFLLAAALPVGVSSFSRDRPAQTDRSDPAVPRAPTARGAAATLDPGLVKQAINRLLANPDNYEAQLELRRLMFALSAEEIPGVLKVILDVPGKRKETLYEVCHALFSRWAELDPRAAADAALAIPRSAYGFYPLRGAFVTWACADLDTAWSWLEKATTDSMNRNFLGGEALATIVAFKHNGAAMMARVDAMKDQAWRKELRFWVLRAFAAHDEPNTVLQWALHLPQDGARDECIAGAVEEIGRHDTRCGVIFMQHIENTARRAEVAHNIIWPYLLARDPSTTCSPPDFVQTLHTHTEDYPLGLFRDAGDALTRHGAEWAMAKLNEFSPGPARDEFIQGMLRSVSWTEARALLPAVAMLDGEALIRHGGMSQFTDVLTKQDPRAAAEWITSLPAGSDVRKWGDSHFQAITKQNAADYLNSPAK